MRPERPPVLRPTRILVVVAADLHLDPDGLRRVARSALRIADGLDVAVAPLPSAAGPAVERAQEDLRAAVRRIREELAGLAEGAAGAATRSEEADRDVAARMHLRAEPSAAGDGPPAMLPESGRSVASESGPPDDPGVTGPGVTGPGVTGPGVTGPGVTGPGVTGAGVTGPGVTGPGVTGSGVPGSGVPGTRMSWLDARGSA